LACASLPARWCVRPAALRHLPVREFGLSQQFRQQLDGLRKLPLPDGPLRIAQQALALRLRQRRIGGPGAGRGRQCRGRDDGDVGAGFVVDADPGARILLLGDAQHALGLPARRERTDPQPVPVRAVDIELRDVGAGLEGRRRGLHRLGIDPLARGDEMTAQPSGASVVSPTATLSAAPRPAAQAQPDAAPVGGRRQHEVGAPVSVERQLRVAEPHPRGAR
jgi:hypothetical protein